MGQKRNQLGQLLRRWTRPPNSLILSVELFQRSGRDFLEQTLEEVGAYYDWAKLTDLVTAHQQGQAGGYASVVFEDVRNRSVRQYLSLFMQRSIPVTFFLRPSCIGLNRLPLEEELNAFEKGYPQAFAAGELAQWRQRTWDEPEAVDQYLNSLRARVGPMPLDRLDPLDYFVTWGKILEIPEQLRDLGLVVDRNPNAGPSIAEQQTFIRQQSAAQVRIARSDRVDSRIPEWAKQAGLDAWLVPRDGIVDRDTDLLNLPFWRLSELGPLAEQLPSDSDR